MTREGRKLGETKGISHVAWTEFTDVWRAGQHGPNHPVDTLPEDWIDVAVFSFEDLATRLDV